MQGARRRPYVDMVKEGNAVDDRPGRNPKGRGDLGASLCREPSQYRHIASGSPPRPASHLASVAHVPVYETGSSTNESAPGTRGPRGAGTAEGRRPTCQPFGWIRRLSLAGRYCLDGLSRDHLLSLVGN